MKIVILGLSITSSWGNGHATTWRALVRELAKRGNDVLFLERDMPWYAAHRDLPHPPFGQTELYENLSDLTSRFERRMARADVVIVGSYVPQGIAVGEWVTRTARGITAFYDIDTPVTLARLERGDNQYLSAELIPCYRLYLSFTGGPVLQRLEREFGSPAARVLHCSVDPSLYFPEPRKMCWELGYLGTWSEDRQPAVDCLMLEPARRWPAGKFIVAGPLYPETIRWPANVERIEHLSPADHRAFYNSQRATLNITRADMVRAGWSPSVRLFEAAACATPIISDAWAGLDTLFEPDSEILIARCPEDVLRCLLEVSPGELAEVGRRARARCMKEHTAAHRAAQLEQYVRAL